jgi:hypothetical protein
MKHRKSSTTTTNPIINPQNIQQGAKHMEEGETKVAIAAREKVRLTIAKWETIKAAVNHGAVIPLESTREVLIGYQYPLEKIYSLENCLEEGFKNN